MWMRVRLMVALGIASPIAFAEGDGTALWFERGVSHVSVPHGPSLALAGDFTIEVWVRPESGLRDQHYDWILCKNYNDTGFTLRFGGLGDDAHIMFNGGQTDLPSRLLDYPYYEPDLRARWIHVAGVRESDHVYLYLNGQLMASSANTLPHMPNENKLWIGSSPFGANTNWSGAIDEVRIWNTARTAEQIVESYQRSLAGNEPGLIAYYPMDEGSGDLIFDATAQTSPGRLGGLVGPDVHDPTWVLGVDLSCGEADITTQGAGPSDPLYGVPDGLVTAADLNYYVNDWVVGSPAADVTTQGAGSGDSLFGIPDGIITAADINYYVQLWVAGCP